MSRLRSESYRSADWIRVKPLTGARDVLLESLLDAGEAAVLSLAREQGVSTVLIDERKARRVARDIHGLQVIGTAAFSSKPNAVACSPKSRPRSSSSGKRATGFTTRLFKPPCGRQGKRTEVRLRTPPPPHPVTTSASFRVDPRLTAILGESYSSSERALRELIDNAWDAEATKVHVTLPDTLSDSPIIVADNGGGMKEKELRTDYLNIASPRLSRKGEQVFSLSASDGERAGVRCCAWSKAGATSASSLA